MEKYSFSAQERAALEAIRAPIAICQLMDKRAVPLILTDGFCELFGYEDRAAALRELEYDMLLSVHPDDAARVARVSERFEAEEAPYDIVTRIRTGSEGYRVVHACGRHIRTESGARLIHLWYTDEGIYDEEGELEAAKLGRQLSAALHEESILRSSHYDHLTGLPNMAYFFELAEAGKAEIFAKGGKVVLLYIDFNGMKFFNHNHSFAEGDKLLKAFAVLLVHLFGSENCCRAAADHFLVYTPEEGLEETLEKLFRDSRELNGGNSLSVRVGIYSTRLADVPVSAACDRAKLACDSLKGTFTSAYSYYSEKLSHDAENKQYILENLDRALEERWVEVFYQPIVRAVNGRVCDEEALARWNDPVKGFLSPAQFIPYLEEAGLITRLDLYVLERVLEKMKRQEAMGLTLVPQSVNLSRVDFSSCDIVEEIRRRVDDAGVSRQFITVEITESTLGSDFEFISSQVFRFQELGFPVWMDDFGTGYSSLDVLQSIKFNLLKFDMSFMRKLGEGDSGKIILTELMRMATSLGIDTVCEGVETAEQVRFLREIGCAKLQGFYYCRPIPFATILERYENGTSIGFENPEESSYYEAIGCVNLYDLAAVTSEEEAGFQNFFNTLPMAITEIRDGKMRFVRTNPSYRDFVQRFFRQELAEGGTDFADTLPGTGPGFNELVRSCCETGSRAFFDEKMPDGSVIHSFARKIASNPVTGTAAAAIAILSITDADHGASYVTIARALAADYYTIYYVDLDTDRFIEYSSPVGGEGLAMEQHGEDFFGSSRREADRIYEEDREAFFAVFTKENILRHLDREGVFSLTYRLMDTGTPMYVNMKITRMEPDRSHLILGVSVVDAQMKQKAREEAVRKERDTLMRIMALAEDYISLYTVDPETGQYVEYSASDDYESLGLSKEGGDFFAHSIENGRKTVFPEDLPRFLEEFTADKVLGAIREQGFFKMSYRLVIHGAPKPVTLRIATFLEGKQKRLLVGVRAWRERH